MVSIPDHLKQFVKIKTTSCSYNGLDFKIETYTVIPTDSNGYIPKRSYGTLDDNTYVKYPELIKLIPRGLSIAFCGGTEVCRLDGLEKFDGSCPLDDDNECSTNIFNQNAADITNWNSIKVEFLEKANGKMAIFKIFKIGETFCVLGGSKNVHVIVGINEDLSLKSTELHYNMLRMFQRDITATNSDIKTSLINRTIIGEYVDGQHIVHVENPYLVYFSGPMTNVKRLLPDQFTLPTLKQLQQLRNLENIEGSVVVYTNLETGTIFRQKHKTVWYILIRVMREGLRHYNKQTDTKIILTKVYGIFKKRSDDFLALTEDDFAKWYVVLKNFILFVKQSKYDFSDLDVQKLGIGTVFHEFMNTDPNQYSIQEDNYHPQQEVFQEPLETPALYSYVQSLIDSGIKTCIIMRGPSGSGKTTVVKKLVGMFPDLQVHSTDNLFFDNGEYKFDASKLELMHGQNFKNFRQSVVDEAQSVCVDNTNILIHEYSSYIELARNNGYVTVVLQCKKLEPEVLFARTTHNVPMNSIIARTKKYQFVNPLYSGIFFKKDQIDELLKSYGYQPKQTSPLHITLFYGRDQINSAECTAIPIGKEYTVNVVSLCTSIAGKFLKVSVEGFENHANLHITLETFEYFKPVDVGILPADTFVEINAQINGVFGPIF